MTDAETIRRKARAKRLLRAMTGVSDAYVEEAVRFAEDSGRRRKAVRIRRWTGFALSAAACFAIVMVGIRVVKLNTSSESGSAENTYDQTANPYEEVGSMSEAEAITGFDLEVPGAEEPYTKTVINVIDRTMIEVTRSNQDETETGYSVRKAKGSDDISGDYTDYPETEAKNVNGIPVTMKGSEGSWSVATWTSEGYSYAINAQENPLTEEEMRNLIENIR